jgi:hypothetical protein
MRKLAAMVLGVMLFAGAASAGGNAWGPVVSYWNTDDASDAMGFGLVFSFEVAPSMALDLRYSWFDDLSDASSAEIEDLDIEVEPFEFGLSWVKKVGESSTFHLGGGFGYYMVDGDADVLGGLEVDFNPEDEWGLYAIAGFDIMMVGEFSEGVMASGMTLFLEAIYRAVEIDEASTGLGLGKTQIQDGNLSGLGANIGVRFLW